MIYVLYHGPACQDGFASAFITWKKFGEKATYIPVQYGEPVPEIPDRAEVYILDFSYKREVMEGLRDRSKSLLCLDHHKTAQKELENLSYAQFDMEESGATLTWKYFFPNESVPKLFLYVRDRDLWKWELPKSREVSAALFIEEKSFINWEKILSGDINDLIQRGEVVLTTQNQQVKALVENSYIYFIGGYGVPVVNSPMLQSEVGHALCEKFPQYPFSGTYFWTDEKTRIWSLRSTGFDVSAVAKSLGGGGHVQAAGFTETIK